MEQKPNQAYNDRVRALAEEFVKKLNPSAFKTYEGNSSVDAEFHNLDQQAWVNDYLSVARLAVRHCSGAVAFALCESGWDTDKAMEYLIKQGLIPDQEGGKNG